MTRLLSMWGGMIGVYCDSHVLDSWVVHVWVSFYGSHPMGHVFAEPVFWVCNYSNMFYKLKPVRCVIGSCCN